MRSTIIVCLLVALCASQAMATNNKFQDKLTSLLNMKSKAVDAVDSALGLLRDLKQANVDAQRLADEHNATVEAQDGKLIQDLTFIADNNKQVGDASTANRKHIENEIQVTAEYLAWINNRRVEINKKRENLREQRCYANFMFIKSLKEHQEAIEVVKFLREDIASIIAESNQSQTSLAQIKDSVSKLQAYAHLFNAQAMKEFAQLTEDVNPETAQWDAKADDNNKDALQLERMPQSDVSKDSIGQKFLDLVDKLDAQLKQAIVDLEKNEIQAAWDLVAWLGDSEKELEHLDFEQAAKTTYQDKLLIAIIAAKAHEDEAWEIYFESASTLNNAVDELNAKREAYAAEKARRDEENALLDEVIQMFIDRVSSLDAGMRNKVNDFSADQAFDNSDIHRRTDDAYSKDNGRLGENVQAEANAAAF